MKTFVDNIEVILQAVEDGFYVPPEDKREDVQVECDYISDAQHWVDGVLSRDLNLRRIDRELRLSVQPLATGGM